MFDSQTKKEIALRAVIQAFEEAWDRESEFTFRITTDIGHQGWRIDKKFVTRGELE